MKMMLSNINRLARCGEIDFVVYILNFCSTYKVARLESNRSGCLPFFHVRVAAYKTEGVVFFTYGHTAHNFMRYVAADP